MGVLPAILIFAGPNGAGKTTYAHKYLASARRQYAFLNADQFARNLRSQGAPDNRADLLAVKQLLREIDDHQKLRLDIALETTLSGRSYLDSIPVWRSVGYFVEIHYLRLPNIEASIAGVSNRVANGGHDVPEYVLRRRFPLSLKHLEQAKALVDLWHVFDFGVFDPVESGSNGR